MRPCHSTLCPINLYNLLINHSVDNKGAVDIVFISSCLGHVHDVVVKVIQSEPYNLLRRLGPVKATLLITLTAVLISVTVTITALLLVYGNVAILFSTVLAILLPGTISPAIAYLFFKLLAQVDQAQREKEAVIVEFQDALANVKRLSGLLPICASCKKIRDDEGYWHQVEVYIHTHTEVDFSHSICPDCTQKLYPSLRRQRAVDETRN